MSRAKKVRDPIFARIAAHANAVAASERAALSLSKLKDRLDTRPTERRTDYDRRLTARTPYFDLGHSSDPKAVFVSRGQIKNHVEGVFNRAAWALGRQGAKQLRKLEPRALAEIERAYDAFRRDHKPREKACGLTAKEKASEKAEEAARTTLQALIKTAPRTPEGRAAIVRHFVGLDAAAAPWWAMKSVLGWLAMEPAID